MYESRRELMNSRPANVMASKPPESGSISSTPHLTQAGGEPYSSRPDAGSRRALICAVVVCFVQGGLSSAFEWTSISELALTRS